MFDDKAIDELINDFKEVDLKRERPCDKLFEHHRYNKFHTAQLAHCTVTLRRLPWRYFHDLADDIEIDQTTVGKVGRGREEDFLTAIKNENMPQQAEQENKKGFLSKLFGGGEKDK